MDEAIKYISKIEIKGLWGRYDLEWNLHPDVNVLSGVNGSGKSTILRYLYEVIDKEYNLNHDLLKKIKELKITFNNGVVFKNTFNVEVQQPVKEIHHPLIKSARPIKEFDIPPKSIQDITINRFPNGENHVGIRTTPYSFKNIKEYPIIFFIKPIDNQLLPVEAIQKLSDDRVKTDLDWQLYQTQQKYLNYQIEISKRVYEVAENSNGSNKMQEELHQINRPKARLIEILNETLSYTDKKVDKKSNDISFFVGNAPLSAYDLSSGEKQILIILLTTLVQDQQPAILFIDEPEISIHFDIQEKLIDYIRELNPNVQIILATHSPAIIMDGWMNNVSEISDLIVHDNQAVLENAE